MTIKSSKFPEILRPNIGLIDPGPFNVIDYHAAKLHSDACSSGERNVAFS